MAHKTLKAHGLKHALQVGVTVLPGGVKSWFWGQGS